MKVEKERDKDIKRENWVANSLSSIELGAPNG